MKLSVVTFITIIIFLCLFGCTQVRPDDSQKFNSDHTTQFSRVDDDIHIRPVGFNLKELTDTTAIEIYKECEEAMWSIFTNGHSLDDYKDAKRENVEDQRYNGLNLSYYVSMLDTELKFDNYYRKMFTDESVDKFKMFWNIAEINGRLAGNTPDGIGSSMIDHSRSIVTDIEQNGHKAVVTFKNYIRKEQEYHSESDFLCFSEVEFDFSDEYGWRVNTVVAGELSAFDYYVIEFFDNATGADYLRPIADGTVDCDEYGFYKLGSNNIKKLISYLETNNCKILPGKYKIGQFRWNFEDGLFINENKECVSVFNYSK